MRLERAKTMPDKKCGCPLYKQNGSILCRFLLLSQRDYCDRVSTAAFHASEMCKRHAYGGDHLSGMGIQLKGTKLH